MSITDFILSQLRYFIFDESKLWSCCSCSTGQGSLFCNTSLIILATPWCPLALLLSQHWPTHHLEVVDLSASSASFAVGKALSLGLPIPQYSQFSTHFTLNAFHCLVSVYFIWLSQSPCTLYAVLSPFCILCAILMSSNTNTFLKFSFNMSSLSSPCMKCSVSFLSQSAHPLFCWYVAFPL